MTVEIIVIEQNFLLNRGLRDNLMVVQDLWSNLRHDKILSDMIVETIITKSPLRKCGIFNITENIKNF